MPDDLRISRDTLALLRCPVCRAELSVDAGGILCRGPACATRFPVVDGVPVLIDEERSVFSIDGSAGQGDDNEAQMSMVNGSRFAMQDKPMTGAGLLRNSTKTCMSKGSSDPQVW